MVLAADTLGLVLAIVGGLGTAVGIITGIVAFVWQWQDRRDFRRKMAAGEAAAATGTDADVHKEAIQVFTFTDMYAAGREYDQALKYSESHTHYVPPYLWYLARRARRRKRTWRAAGTTLLTSFIILIVGLLILA